MALIQFSFFPFYFYFYSIFKMIQMLESYSLSLKKSVRIYIFKNGYITFFVNLGHLNVLLK